MKILYAYHADPVDPHVESGRPYSHYKSMTAAGHRVDVVIVKRNPLHRPIARMALARLRGRRYGSERSRGSSRAYAAAIEDRLATASPPYDLVFAPTTYAFADLGGTTLTMCCVDTLFSDLMATYPAFRAADPHYLAAGDAHEQRALDRIDLLVLPAQVAMACAREHYGVPDDRLVYAPLGSNIAITLDDAQVEAAIARRAAADAINMLFIGRDWTRKNGTLVAATCAALRGMGIPAHAHFIGTDRPADFPPAWADLSTFHGEVDLASATGAAQLVTIAGQATFFFLPSFAEAYGMAFAEAAVLGLPLIGTRAGGIRDIITPQNGLFVDPNGDPAAIAHEIAALHRDRPRYRAMARAARADSRTRLNWSVFWQTCEARIAAVQARRAATSG